MNLKKHIVTKRAEPDICPECKMKVTGNVLNVGEGVVYHPEHFKCASFDCSTNLVSVHFYMLDNLPYCSNCYQFLKKSKPTSAPQLDLEKQKDDTEELDFF